MTWTKITFTDINSNKIFKIVSTPYAHVVWKLNPFSISFGNDITSQSFNPLDDLQSVDINIPNFSDHEFVDLLLCGSPNF